MMAVQRSARGAIIWAIVGGVIVLAGIVAIILSATFARTPPPNLSSGPSTPGSNPAAPSSSASPYVDESVTERGWVPEPITTNPEVYIRAALAAASTFDTQKSTRDEWLNYLDTWFTPDARYAGADREAQLAAAKLELRQTVVLPESDWESLSREQGRVAAEVSGDIAMGPVPEDASGQMRIGTADVTLTYVRGDGSGGETSYTETVRVSVQALCGEASVPTPGTAQRAGDCKVVRFFGQAVEP